MAIDYAIEGGLLKVWRPDKPERVLHIEQAILKEEKATLWISGSDKYVVLGKEECRQMLLELGWNPEQGSFVWPVNIWAGCAVEVGLPRFPKGVTLLHYKVIDEQGNAIAYGTSGTIDDADEYATRLLKRIEKTREEVSKQNGGDTTGVGCRVLFSSKPFVKHKKK